MARIVEAESDPSEPTRTTGSEPTEIDPAFADLDDSQWKLDDDEDEDDVGPEESEPGPAGSEQTPPAPAADQAKPDATATQPDGTQPRNPDGTFAPKAGDPPTPTTPPQGAAPDAPVPPAPAGDAAGQAPPVPTPFEIRYRNQRFAIEGSRVTDEGILIPKAKEPQLRQLLAEGMEHRHGFREVLRTHQERVDAAEQRVRDMEVEVEQWKGMGAFLNDLRAKGPEAVAEFLDELDRNWPKLEAEGLKRQAEALKRQATVPAQEAAQAGQPGRDDLQVEVSDEQLHATIDSVLPDLRDQDPALAVLTDADLATVAKALKVNAAQYFGVADKHYPEAGVSRGDVIYRSDLLRAQLQHFAGLKTQWTQDRSAASAAAAQNARTLGASGAKPNTPPPTPGNKGAGQAPSGKPRPLPALGDKAAFEQWENNLPLAEQFASKAANVRAAFGKWPNLA